jgi:hypothetical protein
MAFPAAVERWRPLVASQFGPLTDSMLAVMQLESGGDPTAHNPGVNGSEDSWGLFQVNRLAWGHTPAELVDPATNVALARQIYDQQGFGAWYNSARALGLLGPSPALPPAATPPAPGPTGAPAPGPDWLPAVLLAAGVLLAWTLLD